MKISLPAFRPSWRRSVVGTLVATCAFVSAPPALAVSEPSALTGEKKSYGMSWEEEIKTGAEADKEITAQMGIYDDPRVQQYVEQVGQRVLAASTFRNPNTPEMYRNTKFTFRVLDNEVVNAFALPGGYVYVTRGLLAHADNEAQLAVVLGHEIAHVAARHASQQARRSQWGQIGVIAGAILGQAVLGNRMPNLAENVLKTGGQAMQVFMLRYSREAEHEADSLGVDYALQAGYAAEESARFFDALRRLGEQEGKSMPNWMSSHPDPGDRADRVVSMARERRARMPNSTNRGIEPFLQNVEGLIIGEDPRQGFTQNGVFYHPTLRFQLPVAPNWKVDNQPAAVVFAEPNGRAVMGLRLAPGARTRDAASQFASENKVQVTASGDTTINGLPASVVVGRAQTEQGQVGVWNTFIEYEGKVYSILGYAPTGVFEQVRPTFEQVAGGFAPLRDARMAAVQPTRLRIVRADRSAPFTTFIPTALPPSLTAEEVAIMNQVALNENVPSGAALKVPDATATGMNREVLAQVPGAYPPAADPRYGQTNPGSGNAYPSTTYPPGTHPTYPNSQPGAPANYPSAGQYPSYPGGQPTTTSYPQYPAGPGYPNQGTYPPGTPSPNGYPAQYPAGNPGYPSQYPGSQYPQSSPYPPGQYPQAGTTYPPGTSQYPATRYPQTSQPQPGQYPQPQSYPQSQYPQSSYPQQPASTPDWPR